MSDPVEKRLEKRLAEIIGRRAKLESLPWSVNGPDAWNESRWLVGPRVFPRDRTEEADMEFIAHAPTDIDWLVTTLAEYRDALDTAWEEIGALQTVCRDAGLVLYNVPRTDDKDWNWRANAVLTLIDEVLPGGIP